MKLSNIVSLSQWPLVKSAGELNIFTNVYAVGRSLIALSLLLTLTFTKSFVYFPPEFFKIEQPSETIVPNLFYLFGQENLLLSIILACLILVLVISGYFPQITGILHAWVAYSFFTDTSLMVDSLLLNI